jgi:hypothetical protein
VSDWVPLRQHLRECLAPQLEAAIAAEQDRDFRAWLIIYRDQVLEKCVDMCERHITREALDDQERPTSLH